MKNYCIKKLNKVFAGEGICQYWRDVEGEPNFTDIIPEGGTTKKVAIHPISTPLLSLSFSLPLHIVDWSIGDHSLF